MNIKWMIFWVIAWQDYKRRDKGQRLTFTLLDSAFPKILQKWPFKAYRKHSLQRRLRLLCFSVIFICIGVGLFLLPSVQTWRKLWLEWVTQIIGNLVKIFVICHFLYPNRTKFKQKRLQKNKELQHPSNLTEKKIP